MNFFRRRQILKRANYLDLTPVRVLEHVIRDDGGVSLLMPRFRNRVAAQLLQPPAKDRFIHIRLDRFGSQTWQLIDGVSQVRAICTALEDQHPGEFTNPDETAERVSGFLTLLYQQRYVTFREIEDK
jgi:hypothetical protein